MKSVVLNYLVIVTFTVLVTVTSCNKENTPLPPFKIEGITVENFPILDGSTTAGPLIYSIAYELLGAGYWSYEFDEKHLQTSQTHNAFIKLIDKDADMIFSARKMSDDEKAYAIEAGVKLIETPIALDALIFIEHPNNKVKTLTHNQLQDIYTGKTKNWKDVGGNNAPITPYIRNKNSGSQELMETLVLGQKQIPDDFPEDVTISGMMMLLSSVQSDENGLGYTVYYYKETMMQDYFVDIKTLAVNGIYPDKKTIASQKYPYTSEVYAIIHSDLDESSMAYKIYELLQTPSGKQIISESGYVPN